MIPSPSILLSLLAAVVPVQDPPPGAGAADPVVSYSTRFGAGNLALEDDRLDDARQEFEQARALAPESSICTYHLACTSARAGDAAGALEWLRRAVVRGYADAAVASFEPDLASLRGEPAFTKVLDDMRRAAASRESEPARKRGLPPGAYQDRANFLPEEQGVLLCRHGALELVHSGTGVTLGRWAWPGWTALVAAHPSREQAILATEDGAVTVVDLASARPVHRWPCSAVAFRELEVSADGALLAAIDVDRVIHVLELDTGKRRFRRPVAKLSKVHWRPRVMFDPASERLLVLAEEGQLMVLDVRDGAVIARRELNEGVTVADAAWSPDGQLLAVNTTEPQTVLLDPATLADARAPLPHPRLVTSVTFHPDGERLITCTEDLAARLWNLDTGELLRIFNRHDIFESWGQELVVHPDGRRLFILRDSLCPLRCWDLETGELLWANLPDGGNECWGELSLDGSGERLYASEVAPGCSSAVFSATDGTTLYDFEDRDQDWIHPSAGGQFTLVRQLGFLQVRQGTTGKLLYTFEAHRGGGYLAYTPGGYYAGDPAPSRWNHALSGARTRPLDHHASLLHDPKRVAAAAAGVEVLPARLR